MKHEELLAQWEERLTGNRYQNEGDPDIERYVAQATQEGYAYWKTMQSAEDRLALWPDLPLGDDPLFIHQSFRRLNAMALAYAMRKSSLCRNGELGAAVADGLDWLNQHMYNEQADMYGNWWYWEIGVPLLLNDTAVLLRKELSDDQIGRYMNAIVRFTPDADTIVDGRHAATGANRIWKAKIVALTGALLGDESKLAHARDAVSDVLLYTTQGDGFYADGSFIQHEAHPYTGGYGKSLLLEMTSLIGMLSGSPWEVKDPHIENLYEWIYIAFEPFMYKGAIMDMVSGREVSREAEDHGRGHQVITGIIQASQFAPAHHAEAFRSMVKTWINEDTLFDYCRQAPAEKIGLAKKWLKDASVKPLKHEDITHIFACMDRVVMRRQHFAFGISMFSSRVYNYESINQEHRKGWYTGYGMTYLYNADLGQYSDFWPTVDAYRMPGTTVETRIRDEAAEWGSHNRSAWVGGTSLAGAYGMVGMELEDIGEEEGRLSARKSWFLIHDAIVALGSDITASTDRTVETIVENRKLSTDRNSLIQADGRQIETECRQERLKLIHPKWVHLDSGVQGSEIGYVFLAPGTINVMEEERTGRWSDIGTGTEEEMKRRYFTMWHDHGKSPAKETYAYMIVPGFTAEQTGDRARNSGIELLALSSSVHAVREKRLGLIGANFWTDEAAEVGPLTCDSKASVMLLEDERFIEAAISDPTHENEGVITVGIDRMACEVIARDTQVEVELCKDGIILKADVRDSQGRTFHVKLRKQRVGQHA